jgi:hypothetical protein
MCVKKTEVGTYSDKLPDLSYGGQRGMGSQTQSTGRRQDPETDKRPQQMKVRVREEKGGALHHGS